jgi:hypothetical protein
LTQQPHLARRLARTFHRAPALALVLAAGLAGCRHKVAPFTLPSAAHAPIDLELPSSPEPPPLIATLPPPELAPLPSIPPPPPRRRPAPAPKEDAQPPVPTAEAAPATLAIGMLSTGGDATPQTQQQAQEMIASILKRIAALPSRTANAQKKEVRQIRHFLDQAQQALNSGDAEGANNLAIKARLLMDDLEKR